MPRGDRTGPQGMGPMSGRGMGTCNDTINTGIPYRFGRGGAGFGFRRNGGNGFGFRNFSGNRVWGRNFSNTYKNANLSAADEKTMLQEEVKMLKEELATLEDRLTKIQGDEK